MLMKRTAAILAFAMSQCVAPSGFAQEKATASPGNASAENLTKEQFMALPPDAVIDFKGSRMTKADFVSRKADEFEQAMKKARQMKAEAQKLFTARRAAFLLDQAVKLEDANRKVRAEVDRLVAADQASHGANWEDRKNQAAQILADAAKAPPGRRAEFEKKADELLAPNGSAQERQ
jgi:hypothetical protein